MTLRWWILSLLLGAALLSCTPAPRVTSLEMPSAAAPDLPAVDVAAYLAKYPNADGVFLEREEMIEHSGYKENQSSGLGIFSGLVKDWVYSRVSKERYIVFNPEARWLTTADFNYVPDKLYMITRSPSGQVSEYSAGDLQKYKDHRGRWRYKFAFPRIEKGTIIETGWEENYAVSRFLPPLHYSVGLDAYIPCEHIRVTFAYPNWWQIANKRMSVNETVPVLVTQDDVNRKTLMVYEARDVPALRSEPFSPPFRRVARYLEFMVTQLLMKGVTYSSPTTWEGVASSARKHAIKKAEGTSKAVRRLADSLYAPPGTPLERVNRIVDFVSRNIEPDLDGNNGDPDKTIRLRRGDWFDMTALARALLQQVGVSSEIMLVHSSSDGWFDPSYISYDQLSYPMLRARIDTLDLALFPYIKNLPAPLVPDMFVSELAMTISEESSTATWTVPEGDPRNNAMDQELDVTLDSLGTAHVLEVRRLTGMLGYDWRSAVSDLEEAERLEFVRKAVGVHGTFTLDSFSVANDTLYHEPLQLTLHYRLPYLVSAAPQETIIQTADLLSNYVGDKPLDTAGRSNPVWVDYTWSCRKQVTIHIPESWRLTTQLDSSRFENQFGTVQCTYEVGPGLIRSTQMTSLIRNQQPKEAIGDVAAIMGSNWKGMVPILVFRTDSSATN